MADYSNRKLFVICCITNDLHVLLAQFRYFKSPAKISYRYDAPTALSRESICRHRVKGLFEIVRSSRTLSNCSQDRATVTEMVIYNVRMITVV